MLKGMVDAGHGGFDPGAVGPTGVQEKVITLAVAKKLAVILSNGGIDMLFTRDGDYLLADSINADLGKRYKKANDAKVNFFISIHCNSAVNRTAHGAEVFTSHGNTMADKLATAIINSMEKALPELTYRKDYTDGDPDKEAGFAVLSGTKMPAVLIELAFISNPTEEALLKSEAFQNRQARAIAQGIANYLSIELKGDGADMAGKNTETAPWKDAIMQDAAQKGLITLDQHQADEPAPKWFTLAVILRAMEVKK